MQKFPGAQQSNMERKCDDGTKQCSFVEQV